ncbi:MAG: type VI secretion system protein TssA [Acidobacteriota bacterium]
MAHVLGDRYDRCCEPLPGDAPMGKNPKYEDPFENLKGEIGNIDAGTTDWKAVETLAVEVLTTLAKDLNAACYLCVALLQRHGYAGLADGVGILRHLVEKHWAGFFPPQERTRKNTFEWLSSRLGLFLAAREPTADEGALLESILEDLQKTQASAREQAEKYKPAFGEPGRVLSRYLSAHQAAQPDPAEVPTGADQTAPAADQGTAGEAKPDASASSASQPAADETPAEAAPPKPPPARGQAPKLPAAEPLPDNAGTSEIRNRLRSLVAPMRQASQLSVLPYRLLRSLKWDDLTGPPAADAGSGQTKVDSPKPQQRKALEGLFQAQKWDKLLEASEGAFQSANGTYWLDLQLYSTTALEEIGPAGGRLAATLREELRLLLERFPALPSLTFKDSSPFASQQTRQWIEEAVVKVELDVVGGSGREVDESLEEEEIAEVKRLFAKKKPVDALAILQNAVRRASSVRSAFQVRLTGAQLCLQANHVGWAKSILEDLEQEMGGIRFEAWEPETAVEVYHLMALAYGRLLKTVDGEDVAALQEALADIQGRLVRLDLRTVARVDEALGDKGGKGGALGRLFGRS